VPLDAFVFGWHPTYEFITGVDNHLASLCRLANHRVHAAYDGNETFLLQNGEGPSDDSASDAIVSRQGPFARQNGTRLVDALLNRVSEMIRELLIQRAVITSINHTATIPHRGLWGQGDIDTEPLRRENNNVGESWANERLPAAGAPLRDRATLRT
jgi:hypothetical protein